MAPYIGKRKNLPPENRNIFKAITISHQNESNSFLEGERRTPELRTQPRSPKLFSEDQPMEHRKGQGFSRRDFLKISRNAALGAGAAGIMANLFWAGRRRKPL